MLRINDEIGIEDAEIELKFVRSGGPGGQHVNKVATAVQLRFDAGASPSLPPAVRRRLKRLAGSRMSEDGVLILEASQHRSQKRNREDAIERFTALLREAARPPKTRRKTKPTAASRRKRLEEKKRRSAVKQSRGPAKLED